jgi:hypothetical protein
MRMYSLLMTLAFLLLSGTWEASKATTQSELTDRGFEKHTTELRDSLYHILPKYNPDVVEIDETGTHCYMYLNSPIYDKNMVNRDSIFSKRSEREWASCGAKIVYIAVAKLSTNGVLLSDADYTVVLAQEGCRFNYPRFAFNLVRDELGFTSKQSIDSNNLKIFSFNTNSVEWSENIPWNRKRTISGIQLRGSDNMFLGRDNYSRDIIEFNSDTEIEYSTALTKYQKYSPISNWETQINYSHDSSQYFQLYLSETGPQIIVYTPTRTDTLSLPIKAQYQGEYEGAQIWYPRRFILGWESQGQSIICSLSADRLEELLGIKWTKTIWSGRE